ncbi:MAG: hypothetical protein KDA65_09655, partial [Planctomycetaceae bacterium]|nr:hypothetical protein [Planctomycetaceae bacterium]
RTSLSSFIWSPLSSCCSSLSEWVSYALTFFLCRRFEVELLLLRLSKRFVGGSFKLASSSKRTNDVRTDTRG